MASSVANRGSTVGLRCTRLIEKSGPDRVSDWIARYRQQGTAGLGIRPGRGRKPACFPQHATTAAAAAELREVVRRSPRLFGLDQNRCVLCTRCVRVCDEVEGAHTWDVSGRGVNGRVITDPLLRRIQKQWVAGKHNVYIADLMPTKFWTDAMFVASQKILAGSMTGEQAGELAHKVTETWKKQNPDMVKNYATWGKDLT